MTSQNKHEGIVLLDKPLGITSNLALQKAKRLLKAEKGGHTGSLDPLATGMLPLCFGEATKYSRFILEENKCYQATLCLGITTTTGDSEGEIIEKKIVMISSEKINNMLVHFQGSQTQIPPMYSDLKHQGQPLYKLARQGISIPRASREIHIHQLQLDKSEGIYITFTVTCSKGTYIRTLAEDMGNYLGCGAHLVMLRRLWVFPFQHYPMISIDNVYDTPLLPIGQVLSLLLPTINITEKQAYFLYLGQRITMGSDLPNGWVSIVCNDNFIGVGERIDTLVLPKRLVRKG